MVKRDRPRTLRNETTRSASVVFSWNRLWNKVVLSEGILLLKISFKNDATSVVIVCDVRLTSLCRGESTYALWSELIFGGNKLTYRRPGGKVKELCLSTFPKKKNLCEKGNHYTLRSVTEVQFFLYTENYHLAV